jgi:hypothetical protein
MYEPMPLVKRTPMAWEIDSRALPNRVRISLYKDSLRYYDVGYIVFSNCLTIRSVGVGPCCLRDMPGLGPAILEGNRPSESSLAVRW